MTGLHIDGASDHSIGVLGRWVGTLGKGTSGRWAATSDIGVVHLSGIDIRDTQSKEVSAHADFLRWSKTY